MVPERRNGPRFRIDDQVHFSARNSVTMGARSSDRFVVVAVMPVDRAGSFQYRIQPSGGGPQRMVSEEELKR